MKDIKNQRESKIEAILRGAVKVLAKKGFEGATIADIANASNVSRGVLHYYFKDKEDIAVKALSSISDEIIFTSLSGLKGTTAEEIALNVTEIQKKNILDTPDFFRFLFEISCLSRRSKKMFHEFTKCQEKVTNAIREWLDNAIKKGIINLRPEKAKPVAEVLLYTMDGVAFHLIDWPEKIENQEMWIEFKKTVMNLISETQK